MRHWLLVALFAVMPLPWAAAQNQACPAMQEMALANIQAHCDGQASGTLCFGNPTVSPVLRAAASANMPLSQPGDAVPIADIDWLSISTEAKTWGAARALLPAYPAEALSPRDAALVAFGNVTIFLPPRVEAPATMEDARVEARRGVNLRALPTTTSRIVAQLANGRPLYVIARSPDREWLLVYASPTLRGWIDRSLVSDANADLPILESAATAPPLWKPWQSLDFHSGIDDAPCKGAPASGILLQAPEFGTPLYFDINGADIRLRGAVWMQAQSSVGMRVHLLDGSARVSANDGSVLLRPGAYTTVPLELADTGALRAIAPPAAPQAYEYHALSSLPLHLLPYPSRVALDTGALVAPAPPGDSSPLAALAADAPCAIAAMRNGANLRSRPDPGAPVISVMSYRQSAQPLARVIGSDGKPWWQLADSVWVRADATANAANCSALAAVRAGRVALCANDTVSYGIFTPKPRHPRVQ